MSDKGPLGYPYPRGDPGGDPYPGEGPLGDPHLRGTPNRGRGDPGEGKVPSRRLKTKPMEAYYV